MGDGKKEKIDDNADEKYRSDDGWLA